MMAERRKIRNLGRPFEAHLPEKKLKGEGRYKEEKNIPRDEPQQSRKGGSEKGTQQGTWARRNSKGFGDFCGEHLMDLRLGGE